MMKNIKNLTAILADFPIVTGKRYSLIVISASGRLKSKITRISFWGILMAAIHL